MACGCSRTAVTTETACATLIASWSCDPVVSTAFGATSTAWITGSSSSSMALDAIAPSSAAVRARPVAVTVDPRAFFLAGCRGKCGNDSIPRGRSLHIVTMSPSWLSGSRTVCVDASRKLRRLARTAATASSASTCAFAAAIAVFAPLMLNDMRPALGSCRGRSGNASSSSWSSCTATGAAASAEAAAPAVSTTGVLTAAAPGVFSRAGSLSVDSGTKISAVG
mmetsp:Transcript_131623/g.262667  ORF Transcript_131623/g.262667 Transcript_131623/m.262667 type:complete len:223 (+) Transcript_131623:38-706(+)